MPVVKLSFEDHELLTRWLEQIKRLRNTDIDPLGLRPTLGTWDWANRSVLGAEADLNPRDPQLRDRRFSPQEPTRRDSVIVQLTQPTADPFITVITDHGALGGLADDDHTQYHTDARGDARYSLLGHLHTGVYSPVGHSHTASDVTDFSSAVLALASALGHTHTSGEVTDFSSAVLAIAAAAAHTHTAAAITDFSSAVLALASAIGHTHASSAITDFNTAVLALASAVGHTHTSSGVTDFNTAVLALASAIGHTHDYADLSDVDTTGIADGDMMVWDATAGEWVPAAVPAGGGDLVAANNLSDVASSATAWANLGGKNTGTIKGKFNAAVAPSTSDDDTAGYMAGSFWVDIVADKAYVCLDPSTGAAVWTEITASGGGGGGDFVGPASSVADRIITFADSTGKLGKDSGVSITSIERTGSKDVASGYAGLDANAQLSASVMPAASRVWAVVAATEFYSKISAGNPPWQFSLITSGSYATKMSEAEHPGIVTLRSSTSNNTGCRIYMNDLCTVVMGGEYAEFVFRPLYVTYQESRLGWFNTFGTGTPSQGIYLRINGDVLTGETLESTPTTSTTGTSYTLTTNTWYRARIVVDSAASRVDFYLYDASGTLLWSDYLTSSIPPSTDRVDFGVNAYCPNAGATMRELLDMDYMAFGINRELTR